MAKTIQVEKIPQLHLLQDVQDMATRNQFSKIIEFVNKLMRDNAALKFRTEQQTKWIIQLEKKLISEEMLESATGRD